MTDQGSLFTITYNQQPTPQPDTPTCPGCRLRPARYNHKRGEYSRYCNGASCSNHQRQCTQCGETYNRADSDGGSKYCSIKCKREGYTAGFSKVAPRILGPCRFCGEATGSPFAVCKDCTRTTPWANALRKHHAPEWVWEHMVTLGTCMNPACRADLTGTYKRPDNGAYITLLHVDHDHTCCAHATSCGNCIRGVLCQGCNMALGMLRDDLKVIQGLATYLDMASP